MLDRVNEKLKAVVMLIRGVKKKMKRETCRRRQREKKVKQHKEQSRERYCKNKQKKGKQQMPSRVRKREQNGKGESTKERNTTKKKIKDQ